MYVPSPERSLCRFCAYSSGALGEAPWDRTLVESPRFIVVPTKGALVAPWLLVLPRDHVLSLASLDTPAIAELSDLVSLVAKRLPVPLTMFEHGARATGSSFGCGIDHAHLHVASFDFDFPTAVANFSPQLAWAEGSAPWKRSPEEAYLTFFAAGVWRTATPLSPPRQFFRQVIAKALGRGEQYDYDEFPSPENAELTRDLFRTTRRSYAQIAERQREATG
jgi:ATP adenylyltransferase